MTDTLTPPTPTPSPARRRLLKALAAGGGALALGGLPARWSAPVVEVGLLPAHAQSSAPGLTNPDSRLEETPCDANGVDGQVVTIQFDYSSPGGSVSPGSVVRQSFLFSPSGSSGSNEKLLTEAEISGTPQSGSITYQNCIAFTENDTELELTLTLVDTAGNVSSPINLTIAAAGATAARSGVAPQ